MLKTVLLATDGSESALAAARWVAALGEQIPALAVTLLYVVPVPVAYPAPGVHGVPAWEVDEADLWHAAEPVLQVTRQVLGGGRQVEVRVRAGVPAEEIVAEARDSGADLIVVGHRGLNPLQHLLLGSVSERVLRLARCPVVVVRA
jgi:nucleotide-binding universal stress UspA family protein